MHGSRNLTHTPRNEDDGCGDTRHQRDQPRDNPMAVIGPPSNASAASPFPATCGAIRRSCGRGMTPEIAQIHAFGSAWIGGPAPRSDGPVRKDVTFSQSCDSGAVRAIVRWSETIGELCSSDVAQRGMGLLGQYSYISGGWSCGGRLFDRAGDHAAADSVQGSSRTRPLWQISRIRTGQEFCLPGMSHAQLCAVAHRTPLVWQMREELPRAHAQGLAARSAARRIRL